MTPEQRVVAEAIRALRAHLKESQEEFSKHIGVSVRTVARYEAERPPQGNVLAMLAETAEFNDRADLRRFSLTLMVERSRLNRQVWRGRYGVFEQLFTIHSRSLPPG